MFLHLFVMSQNIALFLKLYVQVGNISYELYFNIVNVEWYNIILKGDVSSEDCLLSAQEIRWGCASKLLT